MGGGGVHKVHVHPPFEIMIFINIQFDVIVVEVAAVILTP